MPQPSMQSQHRRRDAIPAPARLFPALPTRPRSVPQVYFAGPSIQGSCCSGKTALATQKPRLGARCTGLTAGTTLSTLADGEDAFREDALGVTRGGLGVPQA